MEDWVGGLDPGFVTGVAELITTDGGRAAKGSVEASPVPGAVSCLGGSPTIQMKARHNNHTRFPSATKDGTRREVGGDFHAHGVLLSLCYLRETKRNLSAGNPTTAIALQLTTMTITMYFRHSSGVRCTCPGRTFTNRFLDPRFRSVTLNLSYHVNRFCKLK